VSLVHQSLAVEFDDIELKKYNVSNYLTISGLSSGGFMSIQMHVAYSSILKGVAAFGAVN
jgi:poly(3-hydroxybutyrate) depolymerase